MRYPSFLIGIGCVAAMACDAPDAETSTSADSGDGLSRVDLGEDYQQIGVVEGSPEYQFFRVTGALRLASGRLVVANTGTSELRYYDENGSFLFAAGGAGGGPGEFRDLTGVYHTGPDTIMAFDKIGRRSYFNERGEFLGSENVQRMADRFPMDIWLYRRNWIEGVPNEPETRRSVARSLDRLPNPAGDPAYNFIRIDARRNLWVAEPGTGASPDNWTVYSNTGMPFAQVELPNDFDIMSMGADEILGVWRDENEVEFLRIYALELPPFDTTTASPRPTVSGDARSDTVGLEVVADESRALLRNMVGAQERYFMDSLTYTDDVTRLSLELPELVSVDVISVSGRGWLAVVVYEDAPGICGIGLGAHVPAGWLEGVPNCAQLSPDEIGAVH